MDQIITELNAFIFRIQFVVLVPGLIVAVTGPRALTDCWRRRVTWGFLCGGRLGRGSEQGLTDDSPPPPLHWAHSNNLARRLSSTPKSFEGWCSFTPRTIFNSRALETRRNGTVGHTRKVVCAERLRLYCWGQCGLIVHLCTVQTTGTGPRGSSVLLRMRSVQNTGNRSKGSMALLRMRTARKTGNGAKGS